MDFNEAGENCVLEVCHDCGGDVMDMCVCVYICQISN